MRDGFAGPDPSALDPLLRVRVFSTLDVRGADGASVLPKSRKARGVLTVLAMNVGRPVSREELAELLWSRRERDQARASLRQVVHELSELLNIIHPDLFHADRLYLSLGGANANLVWIDAQAILLAADPVALRSFRHELVADLLGIDPAFDRWRTNQAKRLFASARDRAAEWLAYCRGAGKDSGNGTTAALAEAAELILAIDPEHETALRSLQSGRNSADATYAVSTVEPRPMRVGVTPLLNLDGLPVDELSLGLGEEITYALSEVGWLSCVSPGSVGAGRLGDLASREPLVLDLLIEGTVQRAEGRVRIIIRLLDLHAGDEIVCTRRFDCTEVDILDLQEDIAAKTVAQIITALTAREAARRRMPDSHRAVA
jgi:DNA-binding SARP family transcriptional activator/TolB-like protein